MGDVIEFEPKVSAQPLEEVSPLYPPHGYHAEPDQLGASSGFTEPQTLSVEFVTRTLYWKVRAYLPSHNHDEAIRGVVTLIAKRGTALHPNVPPADEKIIRRMAADLGWEFHYNTENTREALSLPTETILSDVKSLKMIRDQALSILEQAQAELMPMSIIDNNGEMVRAPTTAASISKYRSCWEVYTDADAAYKKSLHDGKQGSLERTDTRQFKSRVAERYTRIYKDYDGMGAVYEVLCSQLAECVVRMELLGESGRTNTDDFRTMLDLQTKIVAQIQKHTESTKSESVSNEAKEMVKNVLTAIEPVIANENPVLWKKVMHSVASSWPKTPTSITARRDGVA